MRSKPVYVLGTHVSHDGSACLLKDGEICVAIEKERITRVKHDGGGDDEAIEYCLKAAGITISDVSLVVQNANFDMFERRSRVRPANRLAESASEIATISHHLAHAYGAIATSPFKSAAVLTVDGCGNSLSSCIDRHSAFIPQLPGTPELEHLYFEKDSYYSWSEETLQAVYKDFSPWGRMERYPMHPTTTLHSIGGAYLGVSQYVFGGMEDPGKLMGLSPYGRPDVYDEPMFDLVDGRVFLKYDWMNKFNNPSAGGQQFRENLQYYADIAYWTQREIEKALMYLVNSRFDTKPNENLAFAGGVALNAVANRLILTKSRFKNVHFQPAAGDNGISIGCAYYGWNHLLKNSMPAYNPSPYHGRVYSSDEIMKALENSDGITYERCDDFIDRAAKLLAQGKKIGWFQKGSEFGPRALGNRSILCDPRDPTAKNFINHSIKFREDFRPFAPSVPLDEVDEYFDQPYESPYMILVSNVRPRWGKSIPAVVHLDGSARVQTVTSEMNRAYYELHKKFKDCTGISVLLNTSLNRRGMPIVETPGDAIALLRETALDALVMEDCIVFKENVGPKVGPKRVQVDVENILNSLLSTGAHAKLELKGGSVSLNFIVSGFHKGLGITGLPGSPAFSSELVTHPDTTVTLDKDVFALIYENPSLIPRMIQSGQIGVPGKQVTNPIVMRSVHNQISSLISLAKKHAIPA